VSQAVDVVRLAEAAAAQGRWKDAVEGYTAVIDRYPDLGLAERARIARALLEYQLGNVERCIVQLEDEEVAFRGSAEVHAALASVLYVEKPGRILDAEQQWDIATEFDTRYGDVGWVERERRWPPKMLQALESFLTLRRP